MKKLIQFLSVFLLCNGLLHAQSVYISELLYNDPSGPDSLEFIELHNPAASSVNVGNYSILGIAYTVPAGTTIPAGGYLVIARDSAAAFRNFGISALQWGATQAFNNTGEPVALRDAGGVTLDSFHYGGTGWAIVTNAQGWSLERCDLSASATLYSSWQPATNPTGAIVVGVEVLATPGAANTCNSGGGGSFPYYTISQINGVNGSGVADSLNVNCELRGVVHSEDFRGGTGIEFSLIDHTNTGLWIFSTAEVSGYVPTRGDSIIARGSIAQFNGRLQLAVSQIQLVSSGNALVTPLVVPGALSESTEGKLLRINNVAVVDTPFNTAAGMTVRMRRGLDTFEVRIDADINAFNYNFGSDSFDIVGIGSQFDNASPYTSGYQIQPRNINDFFPYNPVVVVNSDSILISEIMYNDPSGPDSLEFVEVHNYGSSGINLTGYTIFGINYTFPNGTVLGGGDHLVVARSAASMLHNFGISALEWAAGQGFGNTGEPVALRNAQGVTLDSFQYGGTGWDLVTNAQGWSLERCDYNGDPAAYSSWLPGSTPTGVVIAGTEVLATPGAANNCGNPPVSTVPYYTIAQVTGTNAGGVADSVGVVCELRAVVHSGDFRGGAGLEFAFIDYTNTGIRVFSSNDVAGYVPTRGDSLIVRGTIGQFNGRTDINVNYIQVVSSGNALVTPWDWQGDFTENIEGRMIRIVTVSRLDTPTNNAAGMTVRFTNGGNIYDVRIDNDVNAFGFNFPYQYFNVTGFGSQFDNAAPYTEGYQIMPRDTDDFEEAFVGVRPVLSSDFDVQLFPNPTSGAVQVRSNEPVRRMTVSDAAGRQIALLRPELAEFQFDASAWGSGIYFLTLTGDQGSRVLRLSVR